MHFSNAVEVSAGFRRLVLAGAACGAVGWSGAAVLADGIGTDPLWTGTRAVAHERVVVGQPTRADRESARAKAMGLRRAWVVSASIDDQGASRVVRVDLPTGEAGKDGAGAFERATIQLSPYDLRASGFEVVIDDGSGKDDASRLRPAMRQWPITTYRGGVAEQTRTEATASIVGDELVVASIYPEGRAAWRVQSLGHVLNGPAAAAHPTAELGAARSLAERLGAGGLFVVYTDADVLETGLSCGVDETLTAPGGGASGAGDGPGGSFPVDRGPGSCNKLGEIGWDTDWEYFSAFLAQPDPSAACVADIESVLNDVDFALQRDIAVSTRLRGVILRTTAADPFSDTTSASALLSESLAVWNTVSQATLTRDLEHLMTGRDLDGGTIGLAYVGVICNNTYNSGLSQTLFTTTFASRVLLSAHEIGHEWNAPHDNQAGSPCESTPDGFIMNPFIGGQALQYSPCSIAQMSFHRDSGLSCVSTPTSAPFTRPETVYSQITQSVSIDVLQNDVSNCGAMTLSLPSGTTTAGNTVTINAGAGPRGRSLITFTPVGNFSGPDTFTYTATNGTGGANQTVTVNVAPARTPENPLGGNPGLRVKFYDMTPGLTSLPVFSTLTPYQTSFVSNINVPTTTGNFSASNRTDNVGAVYAGYVSVPTTGLYTFFTTSDDGSRLFIGDTLVVENNGVHGSQERSGVIGLQAGKHAFRVEYFEATGSATLAARYQGPGIAKQIIPNAALSYLPPCSADFDGSQTVTVADLFGFLDAWFAQFNTSGPALSADFNHDSNVTVADLFGFLDAWFAQSGFSCG